MKTKKGLYYPCEKGFGEFEAGYYYYCDTDGMLTVDYGRQVAVTAYRVKNNFGQPMEIRIKKPKR